MGNVGQERNKNLTLWLKIFIEHLVSAAYRHLGRTDVLLALMRFNTYFLRQMISQNTHRIMQLQLREGYKGGGRWSLVDEFYNEQRGGAARGLGKRKGLNRQTVVSQITGGYVSGQQCPVLTGTPT